MSLLQTIRNKPKRVQDRIVFGSALFLVLLIVLIGWFVYDAPYKKNNTTQTIVSDFSRLRGLFSNARKDADAIVEPVDEYFRQQNTNISSDIQQ